MPDRLQIMHNILHNLHILPIHLPTVIQHLQPKLHVPLLQLHQPLAKLLPEMPLPLPNLHITGYKLHKLPQRCTIQQHMPFTMPYLYVYCLC